jgi:hypothetical protein
MRADYISVEVMSSPLAPYVSRKSINSTLDQRQKREGHHFEKRREKTHSDENESALRDSSGSSSV